MPIILCHMIKEQSIKIEIPNTCFIIFVTEVIVQLHVARRVRGPGSDFREHHITQIQSP